MVKIAVVGAGSWGTTLAILIAQNGNEVRLWSRERENVESINKTRENKQYLPGAPIPLNVSVSDSLKKTVEGSDLIINSVPAQFTRGVAKKYSPFITCKHVINVAKGIEMDTHKRMSQVLNEELGEKISIATLSGPNHAEEVVKKLPTATVIASDNKELLVRAKSIFHNKYFRVFTHDDIAGVEVCGALKNIAAIATGVCDGLGYGDNSRASIITMGLMEMSNYGRVSGAKRATFYGLAGVGDLVATCTSSHSRNRLVGEKIAEIKKISEIEEEFHGMIAEGVYTTKAAYQFSKKNKVYMPLTEQVFGVLYGGKELKTAISDLMGIE
jgi:glycerol-3-phosphate dehydrogenase (NAD(P)+)